MSIKHLLFYFVFIFLSKIIYSKPKIEYIYLNEKAHSLDIDQCPVDTSIATVSTPSHLFLIPSILAPFASNLELSSSPSFLIQSTLDQSLWISLLAFQLYQLQATSFDAFIQEQLENLIQHDHFDHPLLLNRILKLKDQSNRFLEYLKPVDPAHIQPLQQANDYLYAVILAHTWDIPSWEKPPQSLMAIGDGKEPNWEQLEQTIGWAPLILDRAPYSQDDVQDIWYHLSQRKRLPKKMVQTLMTVTKLGKGLLAILNHNDGWALGTFCDGVEKLPYKEYWNLMIKFLGWQITQNRFAAESLSAQKKDLLQQQVIDDEPSVESSLERALELGLLNTQTDQDLLLGYLDRTQTLLAFAQINLSQLAIILFLNTFGSQHLQEKAQTISKTIDFYILKPMGMALALDIFYQRFLNLQTNNHLHAQAQLAFDATATPNPALAEAFHHIATHTPTTHLTGPVLKLFKALAGPLIGYIYLLPISKDNQKRLKNTLLIQFLWSSLVSFSYTAYEEINQALVKNNDEEQAYQALDILEAIHQQSNSTSRLTDQLQSIQNEYRAAGYRTLDHDEALQALQAKMILQRIAHHAQTAGQLLLEHLLKDDPTTVAFFENLPISNSSLALTKEAFATRNPKLQKKAVQYLNALISK